MKAVKHTLSQRLFLYFAITIVLLGAAPRAIEVLNHNYLWGFDQGVFYQAVRQIVVNHKFTLIGTQVGGAGGFFQGAGWYYLLTIPFILGRGDPYMGQVMMFVLGVGSIVAAILLGEKMFGKGVGLLTGLFIALAPEIIPGSRFIWPPFPIILLAVFFLYFFYRTLEGKQRYFPWLTLTLGIMTHFETATAATLLIQFLLFTPVYFFKKLLGWRTLLLGIVTIGCTQIPSLLFDLRHHFLITHGVFNTLFHNHPVTSTGSNVYEHVSVFADTFRGIFPFPTQYIWVGFAALLIIGSYLYIRDKKELFARRFLVFYLVLSPFTLFLVFSLYKDILWSWWILELSVMMCFLVSILSVYFILKYKLRTLGYILVMTLALLGVINAYQNYMHDFHDYGGMDKILGKEAALDAIYTDAHGKPFSLFVYTPPVYTFAYDYLASWYGMKKYHYLPGNTKTGTFYLLIEKDPVRWYTYKGWLDTVIKSGKIVWTKSLPSGFILQKRVSE